MATKESEIRGLIDNTKGKPNKVTVIDLDISFFRLVWLLVKLTFAIIPAAIIIWIFLMLAARVLRG